MNIESILDMYARHGIISENEFSINELRKVIDDDFDPSDLALNLLNEIRPDNVLFYSLAEGGWLKGNLIREFYSNVETVVEKSKGGIKVENLELIHPVNSDGEEDPNQNMTISFIHDGVKQEWVFTKNENDNFIYGFTKWAYSALDGNFLYLGDGPTGYFLPKELIKDLKFLGIQNEVNQVRKSTPSNNKSILKDKYLQNWKISFKEEYLGETAIEELFKELKQFSEANNFIIPPLLERKKEVHQYAGVKLLENKILARPFRFDIEVINYVEEHYSEIFQESSTKSNVAFFDIYHKIVFSPIGDGTWRIEQKFKTS